MVLRLYSGSFAVSLLSQYTPGKKNNWLIFMVQTSAPSDNLFDRDGPDSVMIKSVTFTPPQTTPFSPGQIIYVSMDFINTHTVTVR